MFLRGTFYLLRKKHLEVKKNKAELLDVFASLIPLLSAYDSPPL